MNAITLHQRIKTDTSHAIHMVIPPEMGDEVEILVFPAEAVNKNIPIESLMMAQMQRSGFAKNVLDSAAEDCWNDL